MTTNNSSFIATFSGGVYFGGGDATLNKVAELVKAALADVEGGNGTAYTVIQVPTTITGSYGAVALCKLERLEAAQGVPSNGFVTYHILMVEHANAQNMEKYTNSFNGSEYQLDVTVGDYFTAEYRNSVQQVIETRFGKTASYVPAGYQIVYRETNIETVDRIRAMVSEATRALAAASPLATSPQFVLTGLGPNAMFNVSTTVDEKITEPNGLPIRADITLRLGLRLPSNSQVPGGDVLRNAAPTLISENSAYVELVKLDQPQNFGGYGMNTIQPMLIPRVVISNSTVHMSLASLQFSVLSIGVLISQLSNRRYGVIWSPRFGEIENYRDIGALGYLAPFLREDCKPGMLDISENAQVAQLLGTLVTESVAYSMDIRQGGASNWCNDVYMRAAGTDEPARVANEAIVRAAAVITDNKFLTHFKGTRAVVAEIVTNPTGHCTIHNEQVDIANLDLLAILNIFGDKDMSVVHRFIDIEHNPNYDVNTRVMRRVRLLGLTSKAFTVKGYAARVTFTSEFISALTKSIAECGVNFSTNSLGGQTEQVQGQSLDSLHSVLVPPSAIGHFNNNVGMGNINTNGFRVGQGYTFY